jgi:hypothetical protein
LIAESIAERFRLAEKLASVKQNVAVAELIRSILSQGGQGIPEIFLGGAAYRLVP